MYRGLMGDADSGSRDGMAKFLVSTEATTSVRDAEQGDSGGYKHAVGIYLKRRIVSLIFLGFALLYLVQGQIFTLVGYILDLVSGFLGF